MSRTRFCTSFLHRGSLGCSGGGGEEQARELNLLEDWGREWWGGGGGSRYVGVCPGENLHVFKLQRLECLQ